MLQTDFRPDRHGFGFVNYFPVRWPAWWPGRKARRRGFTYGLCGGICFAALDYYHAGKLPEGSSRSPGPGKPLWRYLLRRQLASTLRGGVLLRLVAWLLRPDKSFVGQALLDEMEKIEQRLSQGTPVVLVLIHRWRLLRVTDNHQVVVYGYRVVDQGRCTELTVYDPNRPGEEACLRICRDGREDRLSLYYSLGKEVRAFFVSEAYRPRVEGLP